MNALNRLGVGVAALCSAALLLSGCGGGGAGSGPGRVAGVVTDIDGQSVAGARVTVDGRQTTSLSNGTFVVNGVRDGLRTILAEITINGRRWSGETGADVIARESNRSYNVVVSDERRQGGIEGRVLHPSGGTFAGARVFLRGPWGSSVAVTRSDGRYEFRKLTGGVTYTLTASFPGLINDTKQVAVVANQIAEVSFALGPGGGAGTLPAPTGLDAQAWTIADEIRRSEPRTRAIHDWLKAQVRRSKGISVRPNVQQVERLDGRVTPSGSVIEVDLYWDFVRYNDLYGYLIRRGTQPGILRDTAILRDPLGEYFFDVDSALTPDTTYYYTVHRLDTQLFPANGTVGPASTQARANPFEPIYPVSPGQAALVGFNPRLEWTPVSGAVSYQVIVWDGFPDLQNANDPDGIAPYWPQDLGNPGASLVDAPSTSVVYSGPPLRSGRTYYWLVVARDARLSSNSFTFSVTELRKFTVR